MVWVILYTIFGFYMLISGGNIVCKNANIVALKAKVSQFIIGMTLVAFSTSAPELFTSLIAVAKNKPEMVINNVIGSNLVNIGLAGGLVALIRPFCVGEYVYKRDIPFLIFLTTILNIFCFSNSINCIHGCCFLLCGLAYTYYLARIQNREDSENDELSELSDEQQHIYISIAIIKVFLGIAALIVGSNLVISGCCNIARYLRISDELISFTLLAIGTSLPEIVTSLIAAIRGYGGICAGNILGSNIFNIWMIVGLSALFKNLPSTEQLKYCDLPLSIGYTLIFGLFMYFSRIVTRQQGFCLLIIFIAIFASLINLHLVYM